MSPMLRRIFMWPLTVGWLYDALATSATPAGAGGADEDAGTRVGSAAVVSHGACAHLTFGWNRSREPRYAESQGLSVAPDA
jgi:hypothetical protein